MVLKAQVLPIAHRGASAYAPENTISSIKKAMKLGVKHIEIDVHMTKDGEIVAIHDATIDRTSNSSGKVFDLSLKELKKLDFGSWFDSTFSAEKIPTLGEVLKLTGQGSVLIIEVKHGSEKYPQIENKIINLVKKLELSKQVILKSFSYKVLNRFEKIAPSIERLYCIFWGNDWFTIDNSFRIKGVFEKASFSYLQVHKLFLSRGLIARAHEKNIKVVVWDVDDHLTMKGYAQMNVDFIETNNPDFIYDIQL
jgi:glycerophosphoryl diester phosphodiesterase